MRTLGASMIYSTGKGQGNDAAKRRSAFLTSQVRERFPELAPKRVLEMGCGCGAATWWTAKAYPDADLHAVDVGPAGLRLGHLLAEESGTPVHFRQADARTTGYPDGHFDLIISYILFHETSAEVLPGIFRECKRLLAPGGAMLHVDVGMQYDVMPLSDQVMNDWQTRYNGEPFWTGYGTTDFRQEIIDAGFSPKGVFAELVGPGTGPGTSQVFGAVA
jgi:ubiquinone/menaquinone biosynthesis C-methylase UbiE